MPFSRGRRWRAAEGSATDEGSHALRLDKVPLEPRARRAEYLAMGMRAAGATILGGKTAGADGDVSEISLPGGFTTGISGLGVFYPDKRPTQRVGIVPDIEIYPTSAGIRAARDEVLEAAIHQITSATDAQSLITKARTEAAKQ